MLKESKASQYLCRVWGGLESVRVGKCHNPFFAHFGRNWKVSGLKSVRIGKCQNWKVSELESVRIGNCQNWKVSELESVRIGIPILTLSNSDSFRL